MLRTPDRRRARPRPQPLVHAAHLDERDRPARQPARRGRRGRRPVHRVPVRPAGLDPGAARRLARRADPARTPTGSCACRPRRGSAIGPRRGGDRDGTRHDRPRRRRPTPRTGSRGRPRVAPRTELFIDGRFVPAASGRTFDDIAGRDGSVIAGGRRGRPGGRRPRRRRGPGLVRRPPLVRPPPADRKRVLLRLAELIREHRDELALLESLDVGKPIRDTLRGRRPVAPRRRSSGTPRRSTRSTARSARPGPDALSLVTREPIGVVAAIVPWNYPLIITAWKLGAALATGNSRRPQAGLAVAADRAPPGRAGRRRRGCRTASSTS